MQAFLPNAYPTGAENPPRARQDSCITSNGSSLRNAAQFTLRRRRGALAGVQYDRSRRMTPRRSPTGGVGVGAFDCQDWLLD
jgi:hypothetical protein